MPAFKMTWKSFRKLLLPGRSASFIIGSILKLRSRSLKMSYFRRFIHRNPINTGDSIFHSSRMSLSLNFFLHHLPNMSPLSVSLTLLLFFYAVPGQPCVLPLVLLTQDESQRVSHTIMGFIKVKLNTLTVCARTSKPNQRFSANHSGHPSEDGAAQID